MICDIKKNKPLALKTDGRKNPLRNVSVKLHVDY